MKPMLIFLAGLGVTISHNVVREEAKLQLENLFTYENANQECQRAIAPMHETGNVIDYLKVYHNLIKNSKLKISKNQKLKKYKSKLKKSKTQKIQILAEAMASPFKKKNERYFVCRDKSHLKKDCPITSFTLHFY